MQRTLRTITTCFIVATIGAATVFADSPTVVPVDGKPFTATLSGIDADGRATFIAENKQRTLPLADLVRWGNPRETAAGPIVVTAAGGLLVADVYGGDKESIDCDSGLFGTVTLPLSALAGVVFHPPSQRQSRDLLIDSVAGSEGNTDRLVLNNGDSLSGVIEGIENGEVKLKTDLASVSIETDRISAMIFNPALRDPAPRGGLRCWTGMADGSRLLATKIFLNPTIAAITSTAGKTLKTSPEEVVYLQPLGGRAVYLSDLKAAGYRHLPFLETKWPYKTDRNATGGQLRCGDRIYAKGLGMHSAARLTYTLDQPYKRFDAELGIDDSTDGGGSVRFRVYVDGEERQGSQIVRGGQRPVPISVDLKDARRLDLIVDFADRADQLDRADWMDARLMK